MRELKTAGRALVIDYTPEIVRLLRAVLHTMNGIDHVDSTSKGDTAANLLDRDDYDVVILEAVVPYGEERLLRYLSRSRPSVLRRTIIITAPPVAPAVLNEIERANPYAVLDKPFDVFALADKVRSCIGTRFRPGRRTVCIA
jgi:DNA-binding NtrC family response regulator